MTIHNIEQKISNDGATTKGQLTAEEFNTVVAAVVQHDHEITRATYWDPITTTKYGFASEEDKQRWLDGDSTVVPTETTKYQFAGKQQVVKVINKMPSTNIYFATNQEEAVITAGFVSQEKDITAAEWTEVFEDALFSVFIDRGATGVYQEVISNKLVLSGNDFSANIKNYLSTGANRVRITAVGASSGESGNLQLSVTLTSMYLEPSNFTWYTPFIEGTTYNLGGFHIGGNLSKYLKIKVSKEGYESPIYEQFIGTNTYITTAYYFTGLQFPEAGTGVYNVECWLDANGLESEHLSYNIMCVAAADKFTAQLVAVSLPAEKVYNFSDNELFKYAIYNGGQTTGNPHIKLSSIVNANPTIIVNETLIGVVANRANSYTAALEVELQDENLQITLDALMTYGNEQQILFPVDNSKSYPAATGAVFYLNPSARNNTQDNREEVINSVNSAAYTATFNRMAWTDGVDGWTTDDEGRKCLRLPAMSPVDIAYSPMSSVAAKTIEFVYKVKNAADYDEPIITICDDPTNPTFRGIKITPKNILIHSRDEVTDSLQDYNTTDEETLDVIITLIPEYKEVYGNLSQIYVNGVKVRSFSYEDADRWNTDAHVIFGSQTADLFLYKMRVYDRGFEASDAMANYINSLPSTAEKERKREEFLAPTDDSYKLDYDTCVKNGLNTMVIEILGNDQTIPSIVNPSSKQCNLWVTINNPIDGELDEDFTSLFSGTPILDQTIEGQGTTAMTYARWNFRWKLGSAYNKRRITAKKNFASSMHSHKMGATRLFNDLNAVCVGSNETGKRTAVFQYPIYGFQKVKQEGTTDVYNYIPIGLYTIGPDKGDKSTFGFDDEAYEDTLIHMEGTDHTPLGVGMDYPWEQLAYSGSAEALGAVNATGAVVAAWEVGAAGPYDPKDNPTEVKTMLDNEFQQAYNVAYDNSTYIEGVTATLAEMNANPSAWQANSNADGTSYASLEFWTDGVYDLYYYNKRTEQFTANGVNLLTDLGLSSGDVAGMTITEKNNLFKRLRRERFVANWGKYWHEQDAIFHYAFVLIFGATDNFKKNTYPYKFRPFADGGRYRWRQDDLDTLIDINNQGLAAKIYSILVGDKTSTGSGSIYRGDLSVFWTLIRETKQAEIKAMVHSIFDAMVELSPYGNNTLDKIVGCIRYYFWDKAQEYFPATAYNADAEWTYEETWAAGQYKEVNPLSQSLGGHYEAERDWVKMRVLFLAAYFNYGPFGAVNDSFSDTSTGQIAYGGAGAHTFEFVPAVDFNPTILRGQSELVTAGERVKAGTKVTLTVPDSSGADTRIYVQGVDWMEDVGDLSTLEVSADNPTLTVASKRLQKLKIGDETAENVTSNVTTLTLGECPSMMTVDARNLASLTGSIDLSKLPRLIAAYFGGTAVKSINVPNGSKIETLQLSPEMTQLSLQNLKFLKGGEIVSFTPSFINGKYCATNTGVGNVCPMTITTLTSYAYCSFDCSQYDTITITGTGGLTPRLWCFLDSDNIMISVSGESAVASDLVLKVPENAVTAILNFNKDANANFSVVANRTSEGGLTYDSLEKVEFLRIEGCDVLNPFVMLRSIYDSGNNLRDIRIVGFTHDGDANDLSMIANLASDKDKEGNTHIYNGIDQAGRPIDNSNPVIEGTLTIAGSAYEDDINIIRSAYPNLNLTILGGLYIRFADQAVLDVLLAKGVGDGIGITVADAEAVADIGTWFKGNTEITSFDEFEKFTGVTSLADQAFYNATALTSIKIPENVTTINRISFANTSLEGEIALPNVEDIKNDAFRNTDITRVISPKLKRLSSTGSFWVDGVNYGNGAFYKCANLSSIDISTLEEVAAATFNGCVNLAIDVNCPNLTSIGSGAFEGSGIVAVESLGKISAVPITCFKGCVNLTTAKIRCNINGGNAYQGAFMDCTSLGRVEIFDDVTAVGAYTFANDTALNNIYISTNAEIGYGAFQGCTSLTNISNWNEFSSKVKSIGSNAFYQVPLEIGEDLILPNLEELGGHNFNKSSIVRVLDLGSITTLSRSDGGLFSSSKTELIVLPSTVTEIASFTLYAQNALRILVCKAATPPSLGSGNSKLSNCTIYVPDASVADYQAATNWATHSARIKGIGSLQTDNPTLYNEIKDYL